MSILETNDKENSIIKDLKNLVWHKIAGVFVFNTDVILISKFVSLQDVAMYSSYKMIEEILITLRSIVLTVLEPIIGRFVSIQNKEKSFEYYKEINILNLYMSIFCIICSHRLINNFVYLWLGNKFTFGSFTVILILINVFIRMFRGITETFKEVYGFFDDIYLPILEAIVNFVISLYLAYKIGLNGIIIGTICSNIVIILIAKPILIFKRCFGKGIRDYLELYGNYLAVIAMSIIVNNYIAKMLKFGIENTWSGWIFQAIRVALIVFSVEFFIFLINRDFRKLIFNLVKKIIKISKN